MAFGFPAKYKRTVEIPVDRAVLREAILGVLESLEWSFDSPHPDLYIARVPAGAASWGERLTISLDAGGSINAESRCNGVMPQIFDWGKNRWNVQTFLDRLTVRAPRLSLTSSLAESGFANADGTTPTQRAILDE